MKLFSRRALLLVCLCIVLLGGCATQGPSGTWSWFPGQGGKWPVDSIKFVNRVSWGVNPSGYEQVLAMGREAYLSWQLRPSPANMPDAVQRVIDELSISRQPMVTLVQDLETRRKQIDALADLDLKNKANDAFQQELNILASEAASRFLFRAIYSPNQLQEHMTWFWMNHFHVFQGSARAMIGDYEDRAIRPNALGKFRNLLSATARHPAMLRYLNNEQNAKGHINENFARELMELHTLGVEGGYSQQDVQELARILTGLGINQGSDAPKLRPELQQQYVRDGLFEFNPNRHDYGDKHFLGAAIKGAGMVEFEQAIDRLSRHPATARFISRKLAMYFVSDNPPPALVEWLSATFLRTDGDIASVLRLMFTSSEFNASLGTKFKDPVHYVVSAMRFSDGGYPVENVRLLTRWLGRMGQPLYGRQSPDGYSMMDEAWNSASQMVVRFEVAQEMAGVRTAAFRAEGTEQKDQPPQDFMHLKNGLFLKALQNRLRPNTRRALDGAKPGREWNQYFLSSPEMMFR